MGQADSEIGASGENPTIFIIHQQIQKMFRIFDVLEQRGKTSPSYKHTNNNLSIY